jgi:excisionase family DNA binding protein
MNVQRRLTSKLARWKSSEHLVAFKGDSVGEKQINDFISIERASQFLGGMPIETIRKKVASGEIRAFKPGKHLLFDVIDLLKYVKRHAK